MNLSPGDPLMRQLLRNPAMWMAAAKCWLARALGRETVVLRRNGVSLRVGTARGQGSWCGISGRGFEPELNWALSFLQPGQTFIDVGANVGSYSFHCAKRVGETGRVVSFDPAPGAYALLSDNVRRNHLEKVITPLNAAASASDGKMILAGNQDAWFTMHLATDGPGLPVETRAIDSVMREYALTSLALLKVDAEGAELDVFRGAGESIAKYRPAIIFERIHDNPDSPAQDFLAALGYQFFGITAENQLVPAGEINRFNLIALPPKTGH